MEEIKYIADQIKEIENFVRYNQNTNHDDVLEHVENKLEALKRYAKEHNIPLVVSAEDLIAQNRDEESSSYEEESSSYEEEQSDYDDSEDEDK